MDEKILKELKSIHVTIKKESTRSDYIAFVVVLVTAMQLVGAFYFFSASLFEGDSKTTVIFAALFLLTMFGILKFAAKKYRIESGSD